MNRNSNCYFIKVPLRDKIDTDGGGDMIATMSLVKLLDESEQLSNMIKNSTIMKEYERACIELKEDEEAQQLIKQFNDMKLHYEDVQRFGTYHPDYREIMRQVRRAKRKMDMNDKVATFKIAERNLQSLLDDISELIAQSVSEEIKVPKDDAIFSDLGCKTGCGTGGTCGCQAS